MIIKSHVRGGHRAAAEYLQEIGENEFTRVVSISDPDAATLDEAFRNMWMIASATRVKKPLHHVSINPHQDERLTDEQVEAICTALEEKYGYAPGEHQRVIVEHIKDGRQHFHVMWNRVSLKTGRPVWPGRHWKKSRQVARTMEVRLGLRRVQPRRTRRQTASVAQTGRSPRVTRAKGETSIHRRPIVRQERVGSPQGSPAEALPIREQFKLAERFAVSRQYQVRPLGSLVQWLPHRPLLLPATRRYACVWAHDYGKDRSPPPPVRRRRWKSQEEWLIEWAWANRRADILARFGIYVGFDL